jgi:hypothetical protein
MGTAESLSPQAQAALDALRRLPAAERTAVVLSLAAEQLAGGDGPQTAQDRTGATISPTGGPPAGWSKPNTLTHWADAFGISRATLRKRIADGTVKAQPFGKLWQIAPGSLPAAPW